MLPMLPGIQELVKVMRSDRLDYIHSDILASSGLRYRNADFVDPDNVSKTVIPNGVQRNTLVGQAYDATTDASLPDVVRDSTFQPTEPKPDVVASQFHEFPNFSKNSTSFSEAQTIQPPKPVYTVLTSKKKLHSTKPDTRSPRINELSKSIRNSTIPSEIHKTSPKPSYTVFTSKDMFPPARPNPELMNTGPNELSKSTMKLTSPSVLTSNTMFPSARSNPDLINTGPNEPSRPATNQPACHPTNVKFQMILPKPIYTKPIRDTNTKCSSASPLLYQLLKRNTPSTASACVTSETQLTSSNPVIPTSNKNTICSPIKPTPPNSGLNTLPKSNSNSTKSYPQFQQTATQVVTIVPSSTKGQNCCTKSVTKASTKSNNRQSTSKRVESCVPHESSCDGNLSDVKVKLAREELWKLFYDQGNEMIVGKNGRPMFPTLELSVSGLRADEMYSISVRFICVDKYRYYFYTSCGKWGPTYEARHQPAHSRCFEHPASPTNGHNWCAKPLTFRELRLTNRATKAKNMVYAPTLRKRRVQLVVTMLRCSRCRTEHTRYIDLPLTEFIAVSSYYSVKVTELKIAHNPLAKTRCPQRKRKNCNRKSPKDVPTSRTKKQKTGEDTANEISETNLLASALLPRPINSSDSTHVTMLHNQQLSTATSTQLSTMPDLNTFSILQSTSNSKLPTILSFVAPSVLQSTSRSLNILPSTSSSQLPPISSQTTIISSSVEPTRPFLPIPTSTYPQPPMIKPKGDPKMLSQNTLTAKEQCNTVYTCQTTKPTAHVQTDDDILEYIKIYLSPFLTSEKNEVFDSSVFDELFNVSYISEKLDNFDLIQHLPLC